MKQLSACTEVGPAALSFIYHGKQATRNRPGSVSLCGLGNHRGLNPAIFLQPRRAWQTPGRITRPVQAVLNSPAPDVPVPIKPQAQEPLVLTRKTQVYPRREIREFKLVDGPLAKQRTLLLRAYWLLLYENGDLGEPQTFFQIGGIHGWPYVPYNSDGPEPDPDKTPRIGYCWHGSQLFPTWHRPYVALMEQELLKCAASIASEYKDDGYQQAAKELRLPYWNWLQQGAEPPVPSILTDLQVEVEFPDGKRMMENPLARYRFPTPPSKPGYGPPGNDEEGFPIPLTTPETYTLRHPEATDYKGQVEKLNETFRDDVPNLNSQWGCILKYKWDPSEWIYFSNHQYVGDYDKTPIKNTSLESIHDNVHGNVGGRDGHMDSPEVAGLDPIFFLHHCNVDRLLMEFQLSFPHVYVQSLPDVSRPDTYLDDPKDHSIRRDVSSDYPLHPFRSDKKGSMWTSAECQSTESLGYIYAFDENKEAAKTLPMNGLKAETEGVSQSRAAFSLVDSAKDSAEEGPEAAAEAFRQKASKKYDPGDGFSVRWTISLPKIDKTQFGGSFRIYIFFYKSGTGPTVDELAQDSNLRAKERSGPNCGGVAGVFTLSNANRPKCENCSTQSAYISALVDVSTALKEAGILDETTKADAQLTGWEKNMCIIAVDSRGAGYTNVDTGVPLLHGIEEGGAKGLTFFNANDPPGVPTA